MKNQLTDLLTTKSEPDREPSPVDDFQGILDLPRFQGLYRSLENISLFVPSQSGLPKTGIADLDLLYPSELTATLARRSEIVKTLNQLIEDPSQRQNPRPKAYLLSEALTIDRRLWLHNRRTREAHLALAESLGRGWSDLLISLLRALNYLEHLKANFGPDLDWSDKKIKLDINQVRNSVDSLLSRLKDLYQNFNFSLDDLYLDLRDIYTQSRPAAVPLKKSLASELNKSLVSKKEPVSLRPLPKPNFLTDKSLPFSYMPEKQLFSELDSLPPKALKNRRQLSSEIWTLYRAVSYLRIYFLARLLETEEIVLAWRGKDKAPIEAPGVLSVPAPPAGTKAKLTPTLTPKEPIRLSLRFRRWFIFFSLIMISMVTVIWLEKNKLSQPAHIYAYNGLGTQVTVFLADTVYPVQPGGLVKMSIPQVDFSITSYSQESFIEIIDQFPKLSKGQALVYNIAGASPLFEWEAIYAALPDDPPPQVRHLGAPKLLVTEADFILIDPPKSAKVSPKNRTKKVLSARSGVHPARMLELINPSERLSVIEAQARWNRPGGLWTPLWLDLLASNSPKAASILLGRTGDFPKDPWTINYLLKILGPKNLVGLCLALDSQTAADPSDPDLAYLASLCLPDDQRSKRLGDLLKLWPNQPWLNRAAGLELFALDDLEGALWYLDQAFQNDPTTLLPELETLARLYHLQGLSPANLADDFNFWVPGLSSLTARERPENQSAGQHTGPNSMADYPLNQSAGPDLTKENQAYNLLNRGQAAQALALTTPGNFQDRLIRLAGASEAASKEEIDRALALPPGRGLDRDTAWSMLGLALKYRQPTDDYEKVIAETSPPPATIMAQAIKNSDRAALEQLLPGREAWLQGQACLAAEIADLFSVPDKCPLKARGFLFVGEKPHLSALPQSSGQDISQD